MGSLTKKLKVLDAHTIMKRKKEWIKNITIYRLVDGKFRSRESNDELKRMMELEEEKRLKQEQMEEE